MAKTTTRRTSTGVSVPHMRWLISDSMTWDIAVDGGTSQRWPISTAFWMAMIVIRLSVLGSAGLPDGRRHKSDYGNEVAHA